MNLKAMAAAGAFALVLSGDLRAGDTTPTVAGSGKPILAAGILKKTCIGQTSAGLDRDSIKKYADDFADRHRKIAENGKEPKSKAEMILERISLEGTYGNSAVLTTNDRSWNVDWDNSKWSYGLKVTLPFDMKQRWDRELRAGTSATERDHQTEESGRSALVAKLLKLREESEVDLPKAETLALDIATQSKIFANDCITTEWLPVITAKK